MKLVRWLVGLALISGLVFVAVEVPLGDKTLVEHVRAIAGTREGQELVDGVKRRALEVKDRATGSQQAGASDDEDGREAKGRDDPRAGAGDDLTEKERRLLRKLIRQKLAESPSKKSD